MSIELVTKFQPYVDEQFKAESKRDLLTNQDFDWTGAHTIKIYKVSASKMNDYDRSGTGENWSRYGAIEALSATTQEMTLTRDRSFTFAIDKLDKDETAQQLAAASALARQNREIVIPEVDSYTYAAMCANAGQKPTAVALTADNIYPEILKASEALDNAEVPEVNRVLLVTPTIYALMKSSKDITLDSDIGQEQRLRGVIGILDGASVVKVPTVRLPADFGFMLAHPSATVAPVKLEDYSIHDNPPGISGALVEGRIVYDCFVLDNKKSAIYYQAAASSSGGKSWRTRGVWAAAHAPRVIGDNMAKKRLKMGTSTEVRRAVNRINNMVLNGEIDPKTANALLYGCNVCLGAIRVDDQQAKLNELEKLVREFENEHR